MVSLSEGSVGSLASRRERSEKGFEAKPLACFATQRGKRSLSTKIFDFDPRPLNAQRLRFPFGEARGFVPFLAREHIGALWLKMIPSPPSGLREASGGKKPFKHFLKPYGQNPSPSGRKGCFAFLLCKTKGQKLLQKSNFFKKGSHVKNLSPKYKGVLLASSPPFRRKLRVGSYAEGSCLPKEAGNPYAKRGQQRREEKDSAFFKPFQKMPRASFDKGPQAIEKANPSFLFFLRAKQNYTDSIIFKMLWKWTCKRHPKKNNKWLIKQYFLRINGRNWVFATLGLVLATQRELLLPLWVQKSNIFERQPPFWRGSFLATKGGFATPYAKRGRLPVFLDEATPFGRFFPKGKRPASFGKQLPSVLLPSGSKKKGKATSPFCSSIFRTKAQFNLGSFFISKHNKFNWVQLLPIYYFTNYKNLIPVLKEKKKTRFDFYITIPKHSEIITTHYQKTKKKYAPKELCEQVNDLLFWFCRASKT